MENFKKFPCLKKLRENNYLYCFEFSKNTKLSYGDSGGHIQHVKKSISNVTANSKNNLIPFSENIIICCSYFVVNASLQH